MKRLSLIFVMVFAFCLSSFAEVMQFKTTSYAFAEVRNGSYSWSDWEKSDMLLVIDADNDVMTVYSPKIQYYKITAHLRTGSDTNGGYQARFRGIDQDGDICTIRLRVDPSGSSQVYIDFSNCAWVYTVVRQ